MLIASTYTVFIKVELNCTNKVRHGFKDGKEKKMIYELIDLYKNDYIYLIKKKNM